MPKKDQAKFTFIDLFAGCGGLSEGFLQSGRYKALAHVEWEMPMVETLRHRLWANWKHSKEEALKTVIHFDIQNTEELINGKWKNESLKLFSDTNHESVVRKGLKGLIGKEKVDLIIGGPPCQAYSIAGRAQDKNSMKDDYRNYLFESFVKVVQEFSPKIFVFENVPGLLSAMPGEIAVTKRIYEAFKEIGFEIRTPEMLKKSVYTASDFGVPQKRNRVIIIGVKYNSKLQLEDIYSEIDQLKRKVKPKNVSDAIAHLPKFKPLKSPLKVDGKSVSHQLIGQELIPYHEARYHNTRDIKIFKKWIIEQMNKRTSEEKIAFYNNLIGKNSKHAKYRNLEWDRPSPTVVAHLNKDGLMFIHPDFDQARSITVKEAALLQAFPDDYEFIGSQGYAYKMIGNAVPPQMAKIIASAIANKLNVQ